MQSPVLCVLCLSTRSIGRLFLSSVENILSSLCTPPSAYFFFFSNIHVLWLVCRHLIGKELILIFPGWHSQSCISFSSVYPPSESRIGRRMNEGWRVQEKRGKKMHQKKAEGIRSQKEKGWKTKFERKSPSEFRSAFRPSISGRGQSQGDENRWIGMTRRRWEAGERNERRRRKQKRTGGKVVSCVRKMLQPKCSEMSIVRIRTVADSLTVSFLFHAKASSIEKKERASGKKKTWGRRHWVRRCTHDKELVSNVPTTKNNKETESGKEWEGLSVHYFIQRRCSSSVCSVPISALRM